MWSSPRRGPAAGALVVSLIGLVLAAAPRGSAAVSPPDLGSLDPSFGRHGLVTIFPTCGRCASSSMAVQPDGRILVAGNRGQFQGQVRRFLLDGSPDPTFGIGGIVKALRSHPRPCTASGR
jgi:hypothetical protein